MRQCIKIMQTYLQTGQNAELAAELFSLSQFITCLLVFNVILFDYNYPKQLFKAVNIFVPKLFSVHERN